MKRFQILIAIVFAAVCCSCNSHIKKGEDKDTVLNNIKKPDTTQSVTIDEPIAVGSAKDSTKGKIVRQVGKKEMPKDSRLIFPHFVVKLHDFRVYNIHQEYNGDTSEVKLDMGDNNIGDVTVKKDSLNSYGDPDNVFSNNLLEIVPNNKADSFKVSYSFKISLSGGTDKNPVRWEGLTPYKALKDSVTYFFRVPKNDYESYGEKWLKKRLHLKDTLVTYTDDDGPSKTTALIYKNQPCIFTMIYICLRINRFAKRKLLDAKYLIFSLDETAGD